MNSLIGPWPDYPAEKPTRVLCRECYRRLHYAANTNRFVCPLHGPVLTDEMLHRQTVGSRS